MPSKEAESALDMLRGMLALPQFAKLADEYEITIQPKGGDARKIRPKETRERDDWGSIEQIGKDAYRIRYTRWDKGKRVRRSKTMRGISRREAGAERDRLRTLYDKPRDYVPVPTWGQCWEDWYHPELELRVDAGELAPRTKKLYENSWNYHVLKKYGSRQMDELDVNEFNDWVRTMTDSVARLAVITMKNMVKCAKVHGVTGIDKLEFLKSKTSTWRKEENVKDESAVYTKDEVDTILENLRGSVLEVPAILMGCGSCRVGEACGAKLDDCREVEYKGHLYVVVDIDKQLAERGYETAKPKTKDSVRPVIIAEPWSLRLKQIIDEERAKGLMWLNDDGTGLPVVRAMVSHWWRKNNPDKGVRYLPMTKLRNSWATWMLWDLKIDRWKVDKMMGHAGNDVLGEHYDKPIEEMYIDVIDSAMYGSRETI